MSAVECIAVTKRFGEKVALDRLSITAAGGSVLAIVGRNGAGKSVTVRILSALSWPTSGEVRLCGRPTSDALHMVRPLVGCCLDEVCCWNELTARESVELLCDAYSIDHVIGRERARAALDDLSGGWHDGVPVSEYSLGMKRKLGLAMSLVHAPRVVVWDEPESGLDAPSRQGLIQVVRDLRDDGRTVVLATHSLELVDRLADQVAVLRQGTLVSSLDRTNTYGTRQPSFADDIVSEMAKAV